MPSHYLKQCWNIVNWTSPNKLQWNVNRNSYIFIPENPFQNVVWKMAAILSRPQCVNTLRPRQYGRHFPDDILKRICLNENVSISIKISLKLVPKVQFNNIPTLLQIMAWHWPGDKLLSEPMVVSLLTHICVTRPQWVNAVPWVLSLTVHGT